MRESQVTRGVHRGTQRLNPWAGLFFTAAYFKIEADHSVPVAQSYDGNISGQVVFQLDDLLIGNGDIGAVGQGDIAGHLLLDRDLRPANHGGVTGQALGIDLDMAGPEQVLQPAVERAVQRLIDEQIGSVPAKAKGGTARGCGG